MALLKNRSLLLSRIVALALSAFIVGYVVAWYRQGTSFAIISRTTTLAETDAFLKAVKSIDTKGPAKTRSFLLSLSDSNLESIHLNQEMRDKLRWWRIPNAILDDFTSSAVIVEATGRNKELERAVRAERNKLKSP